MNQLKITVFLFLYVSIALGQSAKPPWSNQLGTYLKTAQERLGFQGVCLVAQGDEVLFQQALGKASIEFDVDMQKDHRFKIASISKSFTAFAVGQAEKEGMLKFSDPVSQYLPELKGAKWEDITVHHLLTHTSGIPHHEGMNDYWEVRSRLRLAKSSILEAIRGMELNFSPGSDLLYSSPGYWLLAVLLESVYGEEYAAIWQDKIGRPMGLKASGLYRHEEILPKLTTGYHLLPGDRLISAPYRDFSGLKGGGDMYSTVEDLRLWNQFILQELNRPGFVQQALQVKNTYKTHRHEGTRYGYGWFIRPKRKDRPTAYFHGGGTFGCSALSAIYPEEEMSIIILSNVSGLPIDLIWQNIEAIVLGLPFESPPQADSGPIDQESMKKYIGSYQSTTSEQQLRIFIHEEALYAQLQGRPPFPLTVTKPHTFYGEKVGISFTFQHDTSKRVIGLKAEGRGRSFVFEKKD